MNLRQIFQKKFQNLFVAIVLNESACHIKCKVYQDGAIKKTFEKSFSGPYDTENLDITIENYLISLQEEYGFVYISFLLNAMGQGAIEGFNAESYRKHSVDLQNVHMINISKQWSMYASFIEIKWVKNIFSETGIDLVYSPFFILYDFIVSQKLKSKPTLYLLNGQDFFVSAVFQDTKLHFGAFFKTQNSVAFTHTDEVSDWESEREEENIANLEEMPELSMNNNEDNEDESLSGLSDLEDIDELNQVDSFSDVDDVKTLGHFKGFDNVKEEDTSLELYGRDLLVYKYLKSSLEEYYHNPLFHGEFIDEIIIFDGFEMSSDLIHQLEDELIMDVEIHKVDIVDRLCDISIKEVFK
ncbi:MAG: hypothetical protein PHN18_07025 [Sulfurospirillaceae bacterium]|nr:hypothetical protein [Sulfurospirillaceae bacterium]MDD2827572.1 hypothetical protein [Sulfurospirillaceae bacterium]